MTQPHPHHEQHGPEEPADFPGTEQQPPDGSSIDDDQSWPPPAELAKYESSGERFRRILPGIAMTLVGLVAIPLLWTGMFMARSYHGEPREEGAPQTAITQSCEQHGPVSRLGIRYWWECTAELDDGDRVTLNNSELTPADVGEPVEVYSATRNVGGSTYYYRNVERPLWWLSVATPFVGGVVVIALFGNAFMRLVPQSIRLETDKKHADKLREQYRRDGRL